MLSHCNPSVLDFKYFTWFSRQYNNSHTNDACHLSWNKYVASWFSICQQTPSHFEYFILVNYLQDSTMVPDSCRPDGHWNKSADWSSKSLQTAIHFISVSIYESAPLRDGHWLTGTSPRAGFQNPYKRRATFSVNSLLSVLEPCPEESDVILMSTMLSMFWYGPGSW